MVGRPAFPQSVPLAVAIGAADRCDFKDALAALDTLAWHDEEPATRLLRARILVQLGEGRKAVEALRGLALTGPGEADVEVVRAFAESLVGDQKAAENALKTAERLGADDEIVQGARGVVLIRSGRYDDASRLLGALLKKDPTLSGALFNLGCLRARQGEIAEASSLVHRAWAAGLKNPHEIRTDPDLAPLRSQHLLDDLLASRESSCPTY